MLHDLIRWAGAHEIQIWLNLLILALAAEYLTDQLRRPRESAAMRRIREMTSDPDAHAARKQPSALPHNRYTMIFAFSQDLRHVVLLKKPADHQNPLFRGKWTAPGGHVEYGELEEKSARRELAEEAHLHAEPNSLRFVLSFSCNCDPSESEHEVAVYAATFPIEQLRRPPAHPVMLKILLSLRFPAPAIRTVEKIGLHPGPPRQFRRYHQVSGCIASYDVGGRQDHNPPAPEDYDPPARRRDAQGHPREPVEVFMQLPGELLWYVRPLLEITRARMRQPA